MASSWQTGRNSGGVHFGGPFAIAGVAPFGSAPFRGIDFPPHLSGSSGARSRERGLGLG
ncbi:keratin, type II cytoskeletal 1b [Anopheles sinensis]|uniref:Keratin, type II cytoskeletal 1b n=1 Tax=Anopheles sinensis TaxID=74873 RepID=A0A084W596_ANOSI|nr:keratin, type II cytoskeletal 1b [Anopheles sinensis]